ncbi:MAG: hypothetical protein K0R51_2542 [Cytophagaceae bacterium]|jgi:hypothetical protein|nr:hypothetical protein [Cytophagaceae bacterium]
MIQTGQWTGHYSFKDEEINKIRGFEKTFFTIEILTVNDHAFTGKVQDDLTTGGTEGIGTIAGSIQGDRMDFVKSMPVMTLLVDRKGTIKTYNKKHRPIFYSGQFSSDGQTVSGTWRFKFGFVWIGIIPVPMMPSSGFWSMTRKK